MAGSTAADPICTDEPLLRLESLKVYFRAARGLVRAVDGVSVALERGRTLGIVGESGSGKSVLARSVLRLLPERSTIQTGGRILFDGQDLCRLSESELRRIRGRRIAMVFQDPMTSLNPVIPIGRQIAQVLKYHLGMAPKAASARALDLLASVGVPSPRQRLEEFPHQLSGGMRQRVMIALALACDPELLIADEPTTALDVTVQAQILDLLHRQQNERGMTLILISHDLGVVAKLADRIAVMYAGRIVEQASAEALFGDMRMPYTAALFRSIPKLANPSHTRLEAIDGRPPDLAGELRGCRFAPRCRFAGDRCRDEEPPLGRKPPDHEYACWHPMHLTARGGNA
ncbi:MAG: ABC transporter ATP-binding protein [Proteobacteria bacterium]|nr:ABC transporter ATP-binding protein [Pseudomonadota bacterium]